MGMNLITGIQNTWSKNLWNKKPRGKSIITVEDFNTSLPVIDRKNRQKMSEDIQD